MLWFTNPKYSWTKLKKTLRNYQAVLGLRLCSQHKGCSGLEWEHSWNLLWVHIRVSNIGLAAGYSHQVQCSAALRTRLRQLQHVGRGLDPNNACVFIQEMQQWQQRTTLDLLRPFKSSLLLQPSPLLFLCLFVRNSTGHWPSADVWRGVTLACLSSHWQMEAFSVLPSSSY